MSAERAIIGHSVFRMIFVGQSGVEIHVEEIIFLSPPEISALDRLEKTIETP